MAPITHNHKKKTCQQPQILTIPKHNPLGNQLKTH